jgi:hypothetical protein
MGMFDWLKTPKSNVDLLDEVIWLTKQAKFTGISAAMARCLAQPARPFAVLLVAHFRDCLLELQTIVEQGGRSTNFGDNGNIYQLVKSGWRLKGKGNAADLLGLDPSTLRFRMKKLHITRPEADGDATATS